MIGMAKRKRKSVRIPTPKELKAFRTARGLTQTEAGELIGVTQRQWLRWETGATIPSNCAAILFYILQEKR